MNRPLPRAVGAATAVSGVAVAARPVLLAAPSGPDGTVPRPVATCLRPLALRDAACGLATACVPDDRSLRTATLLRIASDLDTCWRTSSTLRQAEARVRVATVARGRRQKCRTPMSRTVWARARTSSFSPSLRHTRA
ncbi:hypothetical protein [Streptomyces sp. 1331.2]|uniref:hypothetical protein n=1 Tax=Streptomyces sp. 1331.2 TaxID=1938835 RepID=UPI000BCC3EA9|nr:hypothetical protein [Streptomyces sp. 1331.2]SOB85702.1 hypothetical protein SAMN06272789_5994 [Streptomyces sp. 1331.2]